jgi:hypothetical protein
MSDTGRNLLDCFFALFDPNTPCYQFYRSPLGIQVIYYHAPLPPLPRQGGGGWNVQQGSREPVLVRFGGEERWLWQLKPKEPGKDPSHLLFFICEADCLAPCGNVWIIMADLSSHGCRLGDGVVQWTKALCIVYYVVGWIPTITPTILMKKKNAFQSTKKLFNLKPKERIKFN